MTKLLTTIIPQGGDQLEILVMEIMRECGMSAERRVKKMTARGKAEVDVIATEEIRGITHTIAFECKNLNRRVDQGVVHTFRSILNDAGIHQGYIVSRMGFQKGAYAAADFTNITLCSFQDFQERFFKKWCDRRLLFLNVRFQFLENFFLRQMWRRWVDFCFNDDESRQAYLNHVDRFRYLYASVVDTIVPFDKDRDIDVMELHRTTIDKMVAHDLEIPPDFNAVVDLRSLVNTLCSHIDRAVKVDLYELNPCVGKVLLAGLDQAIKQSEDILGI